jgi:hypothetical protein
MLEAWLNPHPDYKRILGMDDDEYESLVDEAEDSKESMHEFDSIMDYFKKLEDLKKSPYSKQYKELIKEGKKLGFI